MKILLINPDYQDKRGVDIYSARIASKISLMKPLQKTSSGPPLALPILAAVTPKEHSVKIVDEAIENINFDEDCDLIGITAMTFKAPRAYEIAKEFKKRGKTVIIGGVHVSVSMVGTPKEIKNYVDSVVIGEAEDIWPKILEDFEKGKLKKRYKARKFPDISKLPLPAYEKLNLDRYIYSFLQTSRGCPNDCDFCVVTKMNGRIMRFKSPKQVIKEIDYVLSLKKKPISFEKDQTDGKIKPFYGVFFITDDNFAINRNHAIAVSKEIIKYQKTQKKQFIWCTQANYNAGFDDELLSLLNKANCFMLFMGFESLNPESLKFMNKTMNSPDKYEAAIKNMRKHGIEPFYSTIIGTDYDTKETAEELYKFIDKNDIFYVMPNILVPGPGSRLGDKMQKEGRIIKTELANMDTRNVIFSPKNMAPEELRKSFVDLVNKLFKYKNMMKRSKKMRSIALEKQKYRTPLFMRIPLLFYFYGNVILLALKKEISWKLSFRSTYDLLKIITKPMGPIDFASIIYSLDYNSFAESEMKRFKKIEK